MNLEFIKHSNFKVGLEGFRPNVSGAWDNKRVKKGLKALACSLLVIFLLGIPITLASAQEKIDLKVQKDCESARDKDDYESQNLIFGQTASMTKNMVEAQKEMMAKNASPEILISRCDLLNAAKWKAIKSDYLKNIDRANRELKRIVIKYKLQKTIYLTCMKKGELKEMSGVAPECPKGYKELYRK